MMRPHPWRGTLPPETRPARRIDSSRHMAISEEVHGGQQPGFCDDHGSPSGDLGLTTARAGGAPQAAARPAPRGVGPAHHRDQTADGYDEATHLTQAHV